MFVLRIHKNVGSVIQVKKRILREEIYNKKLVVIKLDRESKLLYNDVKFNLYLIDFNHVLNDSLITNEKELEQTKFRYLSKLKKLISKCTQDLVVNSSHDPEKFIFNFSSCKLSPSDGDLLSKGLCFAIPPKHTDYSNFITELELLYRSTLDPSMTSEERDRFKIKLKDIALSSFKFFSGSCKFENGLSTEETNLLKAYMI